MFLCPNVSAALNSMADGHLTRLKNWKLKAQTASDDLSCGSRTTMVTNSSSMKRISCSGFLCNSVTVVAHPVCLHSSLDLKTEFEVVGMQSHDCWLLEASNFSQLM